MLAYLPPPSQLTSPDAVSPSGVLGPDGGGKGGMLDLWHLVNLVSEQHEGIHSTPSFSHHWKENRVNITL